MTNNKYIVPSVSRAIDIIILLSERNHLTLKYISEELKIATSTCFNILSTLESRGIVEKDPLSSKYSLGVPFMQIGLKAYSKLSIRNVALPVVRALVKKYGETSYLSKVNDVSFKGFIVESIQSDKAVSVSLPIGSEFPLYASATGKSLLSGFSDEMLDVYFQKVDLIKFTENTIATEEQLRKEITKIRKQGYAITNQEMGDGASGISAPIRDFQGQVVAAISLAGPSERIINQTSTIIPDVKEAAAQISHSL